MVHIAMSKCKLVFWFKDFLAEQEIIRREKSFRCGKWKVFVIFATLLNFGQHYLLEWTFHVIKSYFFYFIQNYRKQNTDVQLSLVRVRVIQQMDCYHWCSYKKVFYTNA